MKAVKKILIGIAILIALLLVVGLFTKKEYAFEREITINRPNNEVFNYIKYLKNQENYSVWVMSDPQMKKEYRGVDGTAGFVYAWDSKEDPGKGEQKIRNIEEGKRIDLAVHFIEPFEGDAETPMTTQSVSPNQTKLTWRFSSSMKYPMNIMLLFMDMDKVLGKDVQASLDNLKRILENK